MLFFHVDYLMKFYVKEDGVIFFLTVTKKHFSMRKKEKCYGICPLLNMQLPSEQMIDGFL